MKVLIVEDNLIMRHLIRHIVGDLAEVYECVDGDDALPCYETYQFKPTDWVLMDIRMHRINGIEATRRLRKAHNDARVIIVTDYSDSRLQDAAREAGASGYLLKENLHLLEAMLVSQQLTDNAFSSNENNGN